MRPVAAVRRRQLARRRSTAFGQTVHPLTTTYCATCHGDSRLYSPFHAASDVTIAHDAVLDSQKVNLGNPGLSRLVTRLRVDGHYCFGDCDESADTMQQAIAMWASLIGYQDGVNDVEGEIASSQLLLSDGAEGTSSTRVEDAVIALFEFKEGGGMVAADTSNVAPAMDLQLQGTEWLAGGGIEIISGGATASQAGSRKLHDRIADTLTGTNEYTIEAWVTPNNTDQEGPARIVTYSRDTSRRNFTMGQTRYNYVFRNRSRAAGISGNGTPELNTADGDQDLQASLQHVVMTFDQEVGRRIYVNGKWTDDEDRKGPGSLDNWDAGYTFLIGNERTGDRLWKGQVHMVAIHERALAPDEVGRNFISGVGQTFKLSFDISEWTGLAGSAIEIQASEFDRYSYLFSRPTYVGPDPGNLQIRDIRVAVNGMAPVGGQAFRNVDVTVTESGQQLSTLGSVIAKAEGAETDSFTLLFGSIGNNQAVVADNDAPVLPGGFVDEQRPETGLRNFDQINNTMALLTGSEPEDGERGGGLRRPAPAAAGDQRPADLRVRPAGRHLQALGRILRCRRRATAPCARTSSVPTTTPTWPPCSATSPPGAPSPTR